MHPRIRTPFRLSLLLLAITPGCMLISSGPVVIPPPLPPATLAPGDRLLVLEPESAGAAEPVLEPVLELVVAEDGTVELPGIGPMPVDGYCAEDLAAVLLSVQPELGAVRVECLGPEAPAVSAAREASAPIAPAGR